MRSLARKWEKQEADLKILEALYKHKYLRGKILTMIAGVGEKKGYERLSALSRQGFIVNDTLTKSINIGTTQRPRYTNRKVAAIFYLTARGIVTVKEEILKEMPDGKERTRRPDTETCEDAYRISLLLENMFDIYDQFIPVAEYKVKNNLTNFIPLDLAHKNGMIFLEKGSGQSDKKNLLLLCQSMAERFNKPQTLILTSNNRNRSELLTFWKENYGQNERILPENDILAIRHILTGNPSFEDSFKTFIKLPTPQNGYQYLINGEFAHFYDLVGLPAKQLRRAVKTEGKIYIGISNDEEQKNLERLYPQLLQKDLEIITLESIKNTIKEDPWSELLAEIKGVDNYDAVNQ